MLRDGAALAEFYAELDRRLAGGERLFESDAVEMLHAWRAKDPEFLGESFATIAAFGPNAALPHYQPPEKGGAELVGNGMLLIGADAKKSTVNELDANRASRLRAQDFDVTEHDATDYTPGKQYDAVIANPPFGTVKDDAGNKRGWEVSGHETAEIDQAIALRRSSP